MPVISSKAQEIIDFWFNDTPSEKRFAKDAELHACYYLKHYLTHFAFASTYESS